MSKKIGDNYSDSNSIDSNKKEDESESETFIIKYEDAVYINCEYSDELMDILAEEDYSQYGSLVDEINTKKFQMRKPKNDLYKNRHIITLVHTYI